MDLVCILKLMSTVLMNRSTIISRGFSSAVPCSGPQLIPLPPRFSIWALERGSGQLTWQSTS